MGWSRERDALRLGDDAASTFIAAPTFMSVAAVLAHSEEYRGAERYPAMRFIAGICVAALFAYQAQAQVPTLAIGETVAAPGKLYVWATPGTSTSAIGVEAPENQGVVIGGPTSVGTATWWRVAYNDNLTGWDYQTGLAPASPGAPIVSFSAYAARRRIEPQDLGAGGLRILELRIFPVAYPRIQAPVQEDQCARLCASEGDDRRVVESDRERLSPGEGGYWIHDHWR